MENNKMALHITPLENNNWLILGYLLEEKEIVYRKECKNRKQAVMHSIDNFANTKIYIHKKSGSIQKIIEII